MSNQEPVEFEIKGKDMQLVKVELRPGQGVRADTGTMVYMDESIEMNTEGGFLRGIKRAVSGEDFFITKFFQKKKGKGEVAFAAPYPGKIIPVDLSREGGSFICQKSSFLCASNDVEVEVAFTKRIGAGLFGGEGFVLQRLVGEGVTFVHAGGSVVERELEKGERLRVDTGCIAGFANSVSYDIEGVGGVKTALFGGEGFFVAILEGPGKVLVQSLPFARFVDRIAAAKIARHEQER